MLHKLHKQGIRRRKKHIIVVQLISSTLVLLPLFRYFRVFSSHYLYSFHKPFCKLPHPIPLFFYFGPLCLIITHLIITRLIITRLECLTWHFWLAKQTQYSQQNFWPPTNVDPEKYLPSKIFSPFHTILNTFPFLFFQFSSKSLLSSSTSSTSS